MSKTQILVAFIAVLVFNTLAVASASATLWLENGASLSSETAADSTGTLVLHHTAGFAGAVNVECAEVFHGTIGPGALDLVTDILPLAGQRVGLNEVSCKFTAGGSCGTTGELVVVKPIDLPWHGLLELFGGSTINRILGDAEPGYEFSCPKISGLIGRCAGAYSANFSSNGLNGSIFELPGTSVLGCSDGGDATILGLLEIQGPAVS